MSADCCSHDCQQGKDCPARKLVTANSDGSSPHAPALLTSTRPTLRWFAVLIISTALAALSVQHGIRFFN